MRRVLIALVVLATAQAAAAQDVPSGISRDTVDITSSFTGTDVVTFGAIESVPGEPIAPSSARDIVVVVRSADVTEASVRKKERVGPIWVNREVRRFSGVPGFYFVASTRPLKDIASSDLLDEHGIGLDHIPIGPAPSTVGGPKEFRDAIVRAKRRENLYSENPGGVTLMTPTLFRTTTALPANIPAGNLKVSVYLFANGQIVNSSGNVLYIEKTGIERRLSVLALKWPWVYGVAAVALSVLAGFLSSLAFRERD